MNIDIALSSCARVEMMEDAIASFKAYVKTKHNTRWFILEDKVDDAARAEKGRRWIENNRSMFDEVIFADTKMTLVYFWYELLKHVKSDIFIHIEDDLNFQYFCDIDPIISVVENHKNISSIVFLRDDAKVETMQEETIDGHTLINQELFSVSVGVFNTDAARKIVDYSGTNQCHEWGTLTPAKKALGYSSYIWGGKTDPYILEHIGKKKGFRKGAYGNKE